MRSGSRKHLVEVMCPRCKKTRLENNMRPKTCPPCAEARERSRRMDTIRRPSRKGFCCICLEETKFEYYLLPPKIMVESLDKDKIWCSLCEKCFDTWLDTGIHREVRSEDIVIDETMNRDKGVRVGSTRNIKV